MPTIYKLQGKLSYILPQLPLMVSQMFVRNVIHRYQQAERADHRQRLQPAGRGRLENVVLPHQAIEEGDGPEADQRQQMAVERRAVMITGTR